VAKWLPIFRQIGAQRSGRAGADLSLSLSLALGGYSVHLIAALFPTPSTRPSTLRMPGARIARQSSRTLQILLVVFVISAVSSVVAVSTNPADSMWIPDALWLASLSQILSVTYMYSPSARGPLLLDEWKPLVQEYHLVQRRSMHSRLVWCVLRLYERHVLRTIPVRVLVFVCVCVGLRDRAGSMNSRACSGSFDNGRELSGNNLRGSLPASLGDLSQLTTMYGGFARYDAWREPSLNLSHPSLWLMPHSQHQ